MRPSAQCSASSRSRHLTERKRSEEPKALVPRCRRTSDWTKGIVSSTPSPEEDWRCSMRNTQPVRQLKRGMSKIVSSGIAGICTLVHLALIDLSRSTSDFAAMATLT